MAGSLIPPPPDAEIPPPPDAILASGAAPPLDLIGQIKARLTDPTEAGRLWPGGPRLGPQTFEPVGRAARNLGKVVIPGSWPSLAATTASLAIPGAGLAASALRTGAATGAEAGAEFLRGGDPGKGAREAGGQTVFGEALGGVGRAGSRYVLSKLDPLASNLGNVIGRLVPAFKGSTPRQTINNAMGTEGQIALSKQYGDAVDTAITQAGNPPMIDPLTGVPMVASRLWDLLKSEKRRLFSERGEPTRTKAVFDNLDQVYAAEEAFARHIEGLLPTAAKGLFERANRAYRQGKEMQDLFTGGVGHMTPEKAQGIIQPGEKLRVDQPDLAAKLALRAGKLKEAFGPAEYAALEQAIQRGSPLGSRDIPGSMPHSRLHLVGGLLPVPSFYGFPHAPKLVGRPEQQSAMVADTLRRLGVRGAGNRMDPAATGQPAAAPERVSRQNPAVQAAKKAGLSDAEIAKRYGIDLTD